MQRNILLTIAYDGTNFHGWQRQPGAETVQGHLESVMSKLFKTQIVLNGTSRTDAGVHAYGARASFKADIGIPIEKLPLVVNNALAGAQKGAYAISPIRILDAQDMPEDFHARFNAVGKEYIYKIKNCEAVDIFQRNYVYHVAKELNVEKMRMAAKALVGTFDFKAFEASGSNPRETTVRTIYGAELIVAEDIVEGIHKGKSIEFHIKGDGFLYNMVRIITGTLVDVGLGKIPAERLPDIIEGKDRSQAGHTAPPNGLYLSEVYYDKERLSF